MVSNGAKQSILQAVLAVCSPEDEVRSVAPFGIKLHDMLMLIYLCFSHGGAVASILLLLLNIINALFS